MLARYVQKGDAIDYRPAEAVAAGDVVIIADLIGIARLDIEANTLGSLAVVGVFDVVKADGAIPSGSTVYWDAGAKKATTVSGSNHYLGKAIAAAEAADDTVRVLLNAPYSLATTCPVQPRDDLCRRRSDHGSDRQFGRNSVRHDSRSRL